MALSVNKVILVGNLGKDPELRSTPQGKSVCSFSLATSERYQDKVTSEWKDNTEWHNIVAWERLADYVSQRLKKGSKIYLEGTLRHRSYEGKDGVTRYITEVLAREVVIFDKPDGSSSYSGGSSNYGSSTTSTTPSKSFEPAPEYNDDSNIDDDVPF
jgi:single-strand DNA-binding protein